MYTFVKITAYYRQVLENHFANKYRPAASYEESLSDLMAERFGWSDYYSRNLRTLGVDAHEIVANAGPIQQKWAEEHGCKGSLEEILFLQLEYLKPEVVFLQDSIRFGGPWITKLRERVPSIRLVIGWYCSPMSAQQEEGLRGCDFVLCCSPLFIDKCSRRGIAAHLQIHAFEPTILTELKENPFPEVDFVFIGSILPGTGNHALRLEVLNRLIQENSGIELFGSVGRLDTSELWKQRAAYIAASTLRSLGLERVARNLPMVKKGFWITEYPQSLRGAELVSKLARPPVYGIDMLKALAHSKMAFNYHGEIAGDYASNLRMFEVTGVGSCLVTDWKPNLHEMFEPDFEVVSFRSADECVEKVRWLHTHPRECEAIAQKGQQRVLASHTYALRAERLNNLINEHWK